MSAEPAIPIETVQLMREVDEALIPLLQGLEPEDWSRIAVGTWTVRDVAAHLLDGALRRLSLGRDGYQPPPPGRDLSDYSELVGYLNDLNAIWIEATARLSPQVITDLLQDACPQLADYFESLDPLAEAAFPVSWAGEDRSRVWMDLAREFTERWHHQQQIREVIGASGLDQERFVRPLLRTFMRALPRSYDSLAAPEGSRIGIRIADLQDLAWVLERHQNRWTLEEAEPGGPADATIEIPAAAAWRLFTKAITGAAARSEARITGNAELAEPFFTTLAIMA